MLRPVERDQRPLKPIVGLKAGRRSVGTHPAHVDAPHGDARIDAIGIPGLEAQNRAEKHDRQRSPYTHLLRTKAGGIAFVLAAMGDKLDHLVDVTIAYPQGVANFWDFVCGRVKAVKVHVNTVPVSRDLVGNYLTDPCFKRQFQDWLNALWDEKDRRLAEMLAV